MFIIPRDTYFGNLEALENRTGTRMPVAGLRPDQP